MKRVENIESLLNEYEAKNHLLSDLVFLSDVRKQTKEIFSQGDICSGDPLPWEKTHGNIGFRPCELSIWGGINAHGKTAVLSQFMAYSVTHGAKWAIASLEMPIPRLAHRFVIQCCGSTTPSETYIDRCLDWADEKIWVFDELDSVAAKRILAFTRMAFDHLNVDHVVIDSLVKCRVNSEHNEAQKNFVDQLQRIAKSGNGHVHLVHHVRKGQNEEDLITKFDLKGAGEMADLADNIILVHRNKRKERIMRTGDHEQISKVEHLPDTVLLVEKQRHYSWEGMINLWYRNYRYAGSDNHFVPHCGPEWTSPSPIRNDY